MPVKPRTLWGKTEFQKLTPSSKLLYLRFATDPTISVLGVILLDLEVLEATLKLSQPTIRECTKELRQSKFLHFYKNGNDVYVVVLDHFNSIPKSDTSLLKIEKDIKRLPQILVKQLEEFGIHYDAKVVKFKEPTEQEVRDYALSLGYLINAQEFITYYRKKGIEKGKKGMWYNSQGKQVKDWKATLRRVWCKDNKKLERRDDAPEGYEYFFVIHNGDCIAPEKWRNGKPHHSNLIIKTKLEKKYTGR